MTILPAIQISVLVISFALIALFAAAEAAFTSVNRMSVMEHAEQGDRRALIAERLLEDRTRLITVLLVGINICTVVASVLCASLTEEFGPSGSQGIGVSAAVLVLMILVFAEIMPKAVAQDDPLRVTLALAPLLQVAARVLRPLAWAVGAIPRLLVEQTPASEDELSVTPGSIAEMSRISEEQGALTAETGDLIESILSSGDKAVMSVMVPRSKMVSIPGEMPLDDVADAFIQSGFSRLPVYEGSPDRVVGIVHVKDVAAKVARCQPCTAGDLMRPVIKARQKMPTPDLLKEMRAKRQHMAVVTDGTGTLLGLVTINDLLEEIVGEVGEDSPRLDRATARA